MKGGTSPLLTSFPYFRDGKNSEVLDLIGEQFPCPAAELIKPDLDGALYRWLCMPGNYTPPAARSKTAFPLAMASVEEILRDVLLDRVNPRADHVWFEFVASTAAKEPAPSPPNKTPKGRPNPSDTRPA
jgi:hypothetical protein